MTQFTVHTAETAPKDSTKGLEYSKKMFGRVPNIIGVMAESPAVIDGYVALNKIFGQTSFSAEERQLLLLAISAKNGCTYCVPAHTKGAQAAGLAADVIEAIRDGKPIADKRKAALYIFAMAMVAKDGWVTTGDTEAFLDAGFSKAQILEVVLAASLKTISNFTNHIADVPLDSMLEPLRWSKSQAV